MEVMKQYEVVVIGAGLSGVCAAIKLKEAGIGRHICIPTRLRPIRNGLDGTPQALRFGTM